MKILFVSTRQAKPSFRFRVQQVLPAYVACGHSCEVEFLPSSLFPRYRLYRRMRYFDAVFLQKRLLSRAELFAVRKSARRLIYDLDDAVMFNAKGVAAGKRQSRFRAMVQSADLTICGNEYLAEQSHRFTNRCTIIPTPIDTDRYCRTACPLIGGGVAGAGLSAAKEAPVIAESAPDRGFTPFGRSSPGHTSGTHFPEPPHPVIVGWTGSRSTNRYFNDLFPLLAKFAGRIEVKILSDVRDGFDFERLGNVPVTFVPWSPDVEITETATFDVGVMPLPDDPWTRGKCGFKALQYMSLGIPAVCSPVGVNRTIITHGENGFLADSPDEWFRHLSVLIADVLLRRRFGTAARLRMEDAYSLKVVAPQFVAAVSNAAASKCA